MIVERIEVSQIRLRLYPYPAAEINYFKLLIHIIIKHIFFTFREGSREGRSSDEGSVRYVIRYLRRHFHLID